MPLDHESTTPLYIQLKEHLRMQIEAGVFPPGARLPSERELAQTFQMSRMTVRQALQLLAKDGFVTSHIGKGTYVRRPRIAQELRFLTSFTEDMRQRDMTPSSRVIRAALDHADEDVAEHLRVAVGAETVLLSRVRLADNEPMVWEICHLKHHLCPGILDHHDFSEESLYQVLREVYGLRLIWAEETAGARMPNKEERDVLDMDSRTPILSRTRVTYIEYDQPVEYVRSACRSDRYQFRAVLRFNDR
jgi:GntR family transcriptional regulator